MNEKDVLDYKKRWDSLSRVKKKLLKDQSINTKYKQTVNLMKFVISLKKNNIEKQENFVRNIWKKLKDRYN